MLFVTTGNVIKNPFSFKLEKWQSPRIILASKTFCPTVGNKNNPKDMQLVSVGFASQLNFTSTLASVRVAEKHQEAMWKLDTHNRLWILGTDHGDAERVGSHVEQILVSNSSVLCFESPFTRNFCGRSRKVTGCIQSMHSRTLLRACVGACTPWQRNLWTVQHKSVKCTPAYVHFTWTSYFYTSSTRNKWILPRSAKQKKILDVFEEQ